MWTWGIFLNLGSRKSCIRHLLISSLSELMKFMSFTFGLHLAESVCSGIQWLYRSWVRLSLSERIGPLRRLDCRSWEHLRRGLQLHFQSVFRLRFVCLRFRVRRGSFLLTPCESWSRLRSRRPRFHFESRIFQQFLALNEVWSIQRWARMVVWQGCWINTRYLVRTWITHTFQLRINVRGTEDSLKIVEWECQILNFRELESVMFPYAY